MAKQIQNDKGFLVIQCTAAEIMKIENGALGLCGNCCGPSTYGYLPCVLGHRYYCAKCYAAWIARAVNYPEDQEFERGVFADFKSRFRKVGLLEV